MRLTYTCSICKKQNYLQEKAQTRADLQMKIRGDEVRVNCNHCAKTDRKHINRITAVVDNRLVVGGFVLGLSIIIVLGGFLGYFMYSWKGLAIAGSAISGMPVFFWNRENKAVGNFNRYLIKRN